MKKKLNIQFEISGDGHYKHLYANIINRDGEILFAFKWQGDARNNCWYALKLDDFWDYLRNFDELTKIVKIIKKKHWCGDLTPAEFLELFDVIPYGKTDRKCIPMAYAGLNKYKLLVGGILYDWVYAATMEDAIEIGATKHDIDTDRMSVNVVLEEREVRPVTADWNIYKSTEE